ncbi:MAG: DUF4349 domain-containing protein, partial [Pirellulaceae bacterium]|nr:DUF4349 domain-containing protein [Pirellulaceae bacterium]
MDHSAPGDIPADDIATRFVAATGSQPENSASVQASLAALNRKIIYNTTIGLVVENYRTFESDMPALVATHGGFIASNDTQRRYNDNQSGTWVIRVPVTQYSAFLNGV